VRFEPADGLHVLAFGAVEIYPQRGEYQLVVELLEPRGLGALQLAFEQLKERLGREGLFDPARKRGLPRFPRKIGIVTSPSGAALHDMLRVIGRRFGEIHVVVAPAPRADRSAAAAARADPAARRGGGAARARGEIVAASRRPPGGAGHARSALAESGRAHAAGPPPPGRSRGPAGPRARARPRPPASPGRRRGRPAELALAARRVEPRLQPHP